MSNASPVGRLPRAIAQTAVKTKMTMTMTITLAAFTAGAARAQTELGLYNTIQYGGRVDFDGVALMKTSDLFSPHNDCSTFDLLHVGNRIGVRVDVNEPEILVLGDPERLRYNNGNIVDHENPESVLSCIVAMKYWRPNNPIGIDGGLAVSWARLLAKDQNGRYMHHDEWLEDAAQWSIAVDPADFWVSSHYRDGRSQDDWIERLDAFVDLFHEAFGPDKQLGIYIWHRERIGVGREQEWITQADYVEMGLEALNRGCMVFAFGREDNSQEYTRAQQYFNALYNAAQ